MSLTSPSRTARRFFPIAAAILLTATARADEPLPPLADSVLPNGCELTVKLRNGEHRTVDFFGMVSDTLDLSGRTEAGEEIRLRLPKQAIAEGRFRDGTAIDLTLSEASCPESDRSTAFDTDSPSEPPPPVQFTAPERSSPSSEPPTLPPYGSARITSSEEGLPIWVDDEMTPYSTPALLSLDTGLRMIEVRWSVENILWAAQREIEITPGKEYTLHLPLKRVNPTLSVRSSPAGASLWLEKSPDYSRLARWSTPFHKGGLPPGNYNITLRAAGFRDTTVSQHLFLDHPTPIFIEMTPLSPEEFAVQRREISRRNRTLLSNSLLRGAVAPLLSAIFLFAAAEEDFLEADRLRKQIEGTVIADQPRFREIRRENRIAFRSGEKKRAAGWVALGAGGALFLTGAVLQIDF